MHDLLFPVLFSLALSIGLIILSWDFIQAAATFIERKLVRHRLGFGKTGPKVKIQPWKPAHPVKPFWHPDKGCLGGVVVSMLAFLLYILVQHLIN